MALITMSKKELGRLEALVDLDGGRITAARAAGLVGVGESSQAQCPGSRAEKLSLRGGFERRRSLLGRAWGGRLATRCRL